MALDADEAAVREWATAEPLTFPVVIDRDFVVAERYGIVNVPATVWIDEAGKIVRPADRAMGDDRFRAFTNLDSSVHHDRLRTWARTGVRDVDDAGVREHQLAPSPELQLARLHRRVGLVLADRGDEAGAGEHLAAAERLAPLDWTIRRGNMPLSGRNPFGQEFFDFSAEWAAAGSPGYRLGTGEPPPEPSATL